MPSLTADAGAPQTSPPLLDRLLGGRQDATIPDVLRARAGATPDQVFLTWSDRAWTYEQALQEARRFSGWALATRSGAAGSERRIAGFLSNSPAAVWTWLGSLLSGATYVPLNRAHRRELLRDMLERSRADVLVTEAAALELLPDLSTTGLHTVLVVDDDSASVTGVHTTSWDEVTRTAAADGPDRSPFDPAIVMYTSGTTGRSKAVLMPHNEFTRGAGWVAWSLEMTSDDVVHAWLPLYHVAGQLDQTLSMILAGGRVALYPTFSRSRFWTQVDESHATLFIGFANILELIWSLPPSERDSETTLRAGIIGGIPANLHRQFEARFAVELKDDYGMTEANPLILPAPGEPAPIGAAGRPSPDFDLAILRDDDTPAPPGETGEIAVRPRRPGVMFTRYENDAAATLAAVRSLWFHTGDLGRFDDAGFVYFIDRKKHMIRHRGENISSFELESIVLRHPAVVECSAIGVPSPLGDDDVKIVAAPKPGSDLDAADLREWCRSQMATFMVPRYVQVLEALPRTPTGKVLKDQLKDNGPTTWDAEAPTS
jgi:crotonobetaine/carnitine-CoA ligase